MFTTMLTSALRILLTRSFQPFVFEKDSRDFLDYENLKNLGLYVHIPFCRSLCNFCPYVKELYNKEKALLYKEALLAEINLVCHGLTAPKTVTSLYFGGGTPALMAEHLGEIINKLKDYFIITGGIGLELHPDDIDVETLERIKAAGVNMVSIGIQSFDAGCLDRIGRKSDNFQEKIRLVKSMGFSVVDVDLIFAIPGQNEEILFNDIKTAFECGATQVSTYPFIDFSFASNEAPPLSQRVKKKMLKSLVRVSKKLDLERTSVWTFAKKGTDKYSSVTRDNFLGFGPSATTLLQDTFKINTFSTEAYIRSLWENRSPTALTLDFTLRQRAAYCLFWSAYGLQLNRENFRQVTGKTIEDVFGFEILLSRMLGLLKKNPSGYTLTERAGCLYHKIEQVYTKAYIDKTWAAAKQEDFPDRVILK